MSSCGPPPLWIVFMFAFLLGVIVTIIVYLWDKKVSEARDGKQ
jgi:hypothetical protein